MYGAGDTPYAAPQQPFPPYGYGAPPQPPPPRSRRRAGWIVTTVLLVIALIGTGVSLILLFQRLDEASEQIDRQQDRIDQQDDRIDRQEDELDEQRRLIDEKEQFGAAMEGLLATARGFDGVLFADAVDESYYEALAKRGWSHRWDAEALESDRVEVGRATEQLAGALTAASGRAAGNASGTVDESVLDSLGRGFVETAFDDADGLCKQDVLGCVMSNDPYTVHLDAADADRAYMTDWLRTGIVYHEFAHVLQFTNPGPTATAVAQFGGNMETMADCFALTYLDGWTLDHTVWVNSYSYWNVSIGYGYTCNESQRQAVRDWYAQLGYHYAPISQ